MKYMLTTAAVLYGAKRNAVYLPKTHAREIELYSCERETT